MIKCKFEKEFKNFIKELNTYVCTNDNQWVVKGFVDVHSNVFTISLDTKILSKILEIHLLPKFLEFAEKHEFDIILPDKQNYYPDLSFVYKKDNNIKYAVDLKSTYRNPKNNNECNGFTLGSHGTYFINRDHRKNIQFSYNEYHAHFCFGIIYDRIIEDLYDEKKVYTIKELDQIDSVINNLQFFFTEKWKIASDKQGSGNTANIGSIKNIENIINGQGVFTQLNNGEKIFDDYWRNYDKIELDNGTRIRNLDLYKQYRGIK